MTWLLSPSGWPTWAEDGSDLEFDLEDAGYAPIDPSQVAAAVAAYQAGSPSPVPFDFLTEQEAADAASGSGPLGTALRAALVPQRDIVLAPAPSGGDDSAALAAVCTGSREVHLQAGATYLINSRDAISSNGFTGRIVGHGATLNFAYTGTFDPAYSAINGLTDVVITDVSITSPDSNLQSVFRNCTNLRLENITVFGCTPKLTNAMLGNFTARRIRWVTRGSNPASVDGCLVVPDGGGRFVLEDFDYDTIFNGGTGAIVSAVATTPTAGATVHISNGRFFASDLAGHTCDGAIDIEPIGTAGFDSVTIRDVVAYNTTFYLTGAAHIDTEGCTIKYTANNASGRAVPFVVHNSNGTHPPLGTLNVLNNRVEWTAGNPAGQIIGIYTHQAQAGSVVTFRGNRYKFNPAAGQTAQSLYWLEDGVPTVFRIDGDTLLNAGTTLFSAKPLIETDATPDRILVRNMSVEGTYQRKIGVAPYGGGGNGELIAWDGNDFSRATFSNADFVDGSITIAKTHTANNAGIEY